MLINDGRQCTAAANEFLNSPPEPAKRFDRQVAVTERAYLFLHHDSRGGATLVEAKTLVEAATRYEAVMSGGAEVGFDYSTEDYDGCYRVFWCDTPPEGECELLKSYGGDYRVARIEMRWERSFRWEKTSEFVFYKGKKPQFIPDHHDPNHPRYNYRLVGCEAELGEDAFGVVWLTAPATVVVDMSGLSQEIPDHILDFVVDIHDLNHGLLFHFATKAATQQPIVSLVNLPQDVEDPETAAAVVLHDGFYSKEQLSAVVARYLSPDVSDDATTSAEGENKGEAP